MIIGEKMRKYATMLANIQDIKDDKLNANKSEKEIEKLIDD